MNRSVTRRRILKEIAATAIFAPAVFAALRASSAAALPKLPSLASTEALLLLSTDGNFARYQPAYNHLARMKDLYASMRPYVAGAAYVNYCDLELPDWPGAYWGANLARLKQVKSAFDPDNVFRHAQSVPATG